MFQQRQRFIRSACVENLGSVVGLHAVACGRGGRKKSEEMITEEFGGVVEPDYRFVSESALHLCYSNDHNL